jgi:hypothetical protein
MSPDSIARNYVEERTKTSTTQGRPVQPPENAVIQALYKMTEVLQQLVRTFTCENCRPEVEVGQTLDRLSHCPPPPFLPNPN